MHVLQLCVLFLDKRLSKYNVFPNNTFASVIGFSALSAFSEIAENDP